MDPEHASTAGRVFFSQAEKNQKTEGANCVLFAGRKEPKGQEARRKALRRGRPRCGWSGRTRCAQTLPLRDAAALQPPRRLFSGRLPSGRKRRADARSQNLLRASFGKPYGDETSLKLGAGTKISPTAEA